MGGWIGNIRRPLKGFSTSCIVPVRILLSRLGLSSYIQTHTHGNFKFSVFRYDFTNYRKQEVDQRVTQKYKKLFILCYLTIVSSKRVRATQLEVHHSELDCIVVSRSFRYETTFESLQGRLQCRLLATLLSFVAWSTSSQPPFKVRIILEYSR